MAKHGMYDETPSIKHDDEGKTRVEKSKKKEPEGKKDSTPAAEGLPAHVMHAHERQSMMARHEMEHSVHDNGVGGDKKAMHTKHQKEMKDMHTRHEKEPGATPGSNDVGAPIKEIEKGAKA